MHPPSTHHPLCNMWWLWLSNVYAYMTNCTVKALLLPLVWR